MAERGGMVVVDESFADVTPEISVAPYCGRHGLAVLRSFGKFFGLAGLRLGFMLGDDELVAKLRAALGPWPVSGPALAIATKAYQDADWIAATRVRLKSDRTRLEALLTAHNMALVGGTDLFVLVRHGQALDIASGLGHSGILIREFPARPDLLRFGMPADEAAWGRLTRTLSVVS
jgi:cobalamin biosynthetic protein CobC